MNRTLAVCGEFVVALLFLVSFVSANDLKASVTPESLAETAQLQTSQLWGQTGELWSPDSRLPDFCIRRLSSR